MAQPVPGGLMALHAAVHDNRLEEAERLFASIDALQPWRGSAALALAGGWARAGRPDRYRRCVDIVRTAPDTRCDADIWIAQLLIGLGRTDEARGCLESGSGDIAVRAALRASLPAEGGEAAGDRDAAGDPDRAGDDGGGAGKALFRWATAQCKRRMGEAVAAAGDLRLAIQAAPWRLDWWLELADTLISSGNAHLLGRHWAELPGSFPTSRRWLLLACRASMLSIRESARALDHCRMAQVLDPSGWQAYGAEAQILSDHAALDRVADAFARYWQRGTAAAGKAGDDVMATGEGAAGERAAAAGRRAVLLAPTAANWNDLGAVYFAMGAVGQAVEAFAQALAIDPRQRHAAINHAVAQLCLGDVEAVREHLERTEFLAPLPKSLLLIGEGGAAVDRVGGWPAAWRAPVDSGEWRRRCVFSQSWWREDLP